MNNKDENGLKQGYWECDYDIYTWKGIFKNGLEYGAWDVYINELRIEKIFYLKGVRLSGVFYQHDCVRYFLEFGLTIHDEDVI